MPGHSRNPIGSWVKRWTSISSSLCWRASPSRESVPTITRPDSAVEIDRDCMPDCPCRVLVIRTRRRLVASASSPSHLKNKSGIRQFTPMATSFVVLAARSRDEEEDRLGLTFASDRRAWRACVLRHRSCGQCGTGALRFPPSVKRESRYLVSGAMTRSRGNMVEPATTVAPERSPVSRGPAGQGRWPVRVSRWLAAALSKL